jgi:hypothetical protein
VAYYWFFIPASAMSLAGVAGMCPARDSLLESATPDPKRAYSHSLGAVSTLRVGYSAAGPELTSRDVRCSVDIRSKADYRRHRISVAIDPKRADRHRSPGRVTA